MIPAWRNHTKPKGRSRY